jgi:hypothetical protein
MLAAERQRDASAHKAEERHQSKKGLIRVQIRDFPADYIVFAARSVHCHFF